MRVSSSPARIEASFFDLAGASAYLGGAWGVRTLRRMIAAGHLPFYRVGRSKVMLRKVDLDGFLEEHRQRTVDLDAVVDQALAEMGRK
jgi:excisionase family DNA binding protein